MAKAFWGRLVLALCLLLLAAAGYWPGLTGTYLLDDFGTLPAVAQWGQLNSLDKLFEYLQGGHAGPTGRPVALLSFAANASDWPAPPFPFLLTNILIHLLNGLLLALVLARALKISGVVEYQKVAIFTAAIWLLHPSQVSTVLYIVQRMTELELTFNLLAIFSYLYLRDALIQEQLLKATWLLGILGGMSVLAVCSKENAVLIPLQLALLEFVLLRASRPSNKRYYQWLLTPLIIIPSIIVLAYLIQKGMHYIYDGHRHSARIFTGWERLLTEFRVIGDYLVMFFLPKMQSAGVFHDGYPISKGLLSPLATSGWAIFHGFLLLFAFIVKRKWPVLCFAVLWFYVNHLLESTVIQLELKFEHRNYLPSIGLALIVALGLCKLPLKTGARQAVFGVIVLLLTFCLYMRASLWGDPVIAAGVWSEKNPNSYRALEHAAMIYSNSENGGKKAKEYLRKAIKASGTDPTVEMKYILYTCSEPQLGDEVMTSLVARYPNAPMNWQTGSIFEALLDKVAEGDCNVLTVLNYKRLIAAALQNSRYRQTRMRLHLLHLQAKAELLLGDEDRAVAMFEKSFSTAVVPLGIVMKQAVLLASHDKLQQAYRHINRAIEYRAHEKGFLLIQAKEIRDNIHRELRANKKVD